jgi:hypothetical protein
MSREQRKTKRLTMHLNAGTLLFTLYYLLIVLTSSRFRLQGKRNRQDGDSGATFQTTPVMKLLNTLRVGGY